MKTIVIKSHLKFFILLIILKVSCLSANAQSQSAIVITADQPNIWTLEQAHYLLEQMHRRNLDLKAASVGELDANEINGVNIDILKTLLEASAEYDQAKGINNGLRKNQKQFDSQRRQELLIKRSQLEDESLDLTRQIADLKIKMGKTDSDVDKNKIQSQINELEIVQAAVKEQITQINTDLGTISPVSGDFEKPTLEGGFDKTKFSDTLDSAFSSTVKTVLDGFNKQAPKLNASLRLENYLQMEYEILSKQLTLLRDEVGPGERVIFLEMPQSIKASYDKADNKWAQSWWKIRAYTTCQEVTSEYELTSKRVDDVADGLLEIIQTINVFQKSVQNDLPAPDAQFDGEIETVTANLETAARKTRAAADFGEVVSKALDQNKNDYQDEKQTAKSQLVGMLQDALTEANDAIASIDDVLNEQARIKGVAANKDSKKNAEIKSKIENEFKDLSKALGNFKKNQLRDAHLSWLKLKIPNFIKPVSELVAEINTNLAGLGSSDTGDILAPIMLSQLGTEKGNKSCSSSLTDYRDTSSVIEDLIKGNDRRIIKVVDLDKGLDLNADQTIKSPLGEILGIDNKLPTDKDTVQQYPLLENREARVVDLFPRQSSLNVNDIKYKSNALSLRMLFSIISGFGAKVNYQRSREQYSQFVQQELYSSAFGKGAREFGWTFNPMPGTKRLMSGVRTTYAIMVIPQKATTLLLQSTGCYYTRSERQLPDFKSALMFHEEDRPSGKGNCSESRSFLIPIPNAISGDNAFWVENISYQPVDQNRKVVISIRGKDFSNQIGVLVDGVALKPSLGLGQPFIIDDSRTKDSVTADSEIKGSFERVDSEQIIASFEMGKDYKGTPTITLIAPGKGIVLNSIPKLNILINGESCKNNSNIPCKGLGEAPFMFGKNDSPDKSDAKIGSVKLFKVSKENDHLTAIITGENLDTVQAILVNGNICTLDANVKKKTVLRCTFDNLDEKKIFITLITANKSVQSTEIDNPVTKSNDSQQTAPANDKYQVDPAKFSISKFEYIGPTLEPNSTGVIFRITLNAPTEKLNASIGDLEAISTSEYKYTIDRMKISKVTTFDNGKDLKFNYLITMPQTAPKQPRKRKNQ